jgi:hypothetical protein
MAALVLWEIKGILRRSEPAGTYWNLLLDVGQDAPLKVSASPMVGIQAKTLVNRSVHVVGTMLSWRAKGRTETFGVTIIAGSVELDEPWTQQSEFEPQEVQQEIPEF